MSQDWDLFAVVRSCSSSSTATTIINGGDDDHDTKPENPLSCLEGLTFEDDEQEQQEHFLFPGFRGQNNNIKDRGDSSCNELHDSCKPFLLPPPNSSCCSSSSTSSSSSVSVVSASYNCSTALRQEQATEHDRRAVGVNVSIPRSTTATSVFVFRSRREELQLQQQQQQQLTQVQGRSKKRKNQQKRTISHVTQENLSSDMWAWRKYGQKPIKGSPYPRNYYRCSSSKGCLARKQVERSNLDPNIFIVTYTGEHTHPRPTHRNSLAGSTRNKPQPANPNNKPDTVGQGQANRLGSGAAKTDQNLSPTTPLKESDDVKGTNAVADEEISQEIFMGDEEEVVVEEEEDDDDVVVDGDDDDVDGLLIPNLSVRDHEDLFSNMQEFAGNFNSWSPGSSSAPAGAPDGASG